MKALAYSLWLVLFWWFTWLCTRDPHQVNLTGFNLLVSATASIAGEARPICISLILI